MENISIGDRFYKLATEYSHANACSNCGRLRKGEGWSGDNNCSSCGRSYSILTKKVKPVYVIGVGKDYRDKITLQLCEKKPEQLNEKSYSYWNTTADKIGSEFYATKEEVDTKQIIF